MRPITLISLSVALTFFCVPFDGNAQTIKIGAVVPLTGRYAALGGQVKPSRAWKPSPPRAS